MAKVEDSDSIGTQIVLLESDLSDQEIWDALAFHYADTLNMAWMLTYYDFMSNTKGTPVEKGAHIPPTLMVVNPNYLNKFALTFLLCTKLGITVDTAIRAAKGLIYRAARAEAALTPEHLLGINDIIYGD